jgi:cobalamin biosynthesis Mg chelatase CobN
MTADGPDKTAVVMVTDMTITGRPAQFGRGVVSDVADKIIGQFASCVASKLQAGDAPSAEASSEGSAPVPAAVPASASAAGAASSNGSTGSAATATAPTATAPAATAKPSAASTAPMKSEIDAIDLLDTAGAPVIKRLAPVVGGLGLLLLVIFLIRRLRSS